MPLKHSTETVLVVLLAILFAIVGIAMGLLPTSLDPGVLTLWGIVFGLSLLYALIITPLLRSQRAEYEIRVLHFLPALILLFWVLLAYLGIALPWIRSILHFLTWGLSLPVITLCFLLLALFCMNVVRQWPERILLLAILFIPFLVLGLTLESWNTPARFAELVRERGNIFAVFQGHSGSGKNLFASLFQSPTNASQMSAVSVTSRSSSASSISSAQSAESQAPIVVARGTSTPLVPATISASKPVTPNHLPTSGPEDFALLALLLPIAYSTTLHVRARRRMLVAA